MNLYNAKIGREAVVDKIDVEKEFRDRLEVLGLTEGVRVKVIKYSPFNDLIEIKLRGEYVAIRKETAERIGVYYV